MQIIDGKLCYDMDEIPREQVFRDLGYQIIATDEPKKVLPIMRYLLFNEVKFLVDNNLLEELRSKDISEYIEHGLSKLVDAVTLKFFKYLRDVAKDSRIHPASADIQTYYDYTFSKEERTKLEMYSTENPDVFDTYAQIFLKEIVIPSLHYLLEKHCDKLYNIQVVKAYTCVSSTNLEDTSQEELMKIIDANKNEEVEEFTVPIFKGYVMRKKAEENNEEET